MDEDNRHRASERIRVELIEADVEMAFSLLDDALDEFHDGNVLFAQRALQDAENVLTDIEERMHELDAERSTPFGPLVEELLKAVRAAQSECA